MQKALEVRGRGWGSTATPSEDQDVISEVVAVAVKY